MSRTERMYIGDTKNIEVVYTRVLVWLREEKRKEKRKRMTREKKTVCQRLVFLCVFSNRR